MSKIKSNGIEKRTTNRSGKQPRSIRVADGGVETGREFAQLMSALMSDLIDGRVTPQVGNATCNAGGKLLKIVEMQHRFGGLRTQSKLHHRDIVLVR
jgi:hypothetical protein